jgi:hypothetical protein
MVTGTTSGLLLVSCLGCLSPQGDDVVRVQAGPPPSVEAFETAQLSYDRLFERLDNQSFGLPLSVGNDFGPSRFAAPAEAGRMGALNLTTPMALRMQAGDTLSAEVSFGAFASRTGLGLDFELAPRAQIQQNRAGNDVARTGGEIRVGRNLAERDQRGTSAGAPAWYFFLGADNEALIWNVSDRNAIDGVSLRDQVTVGDRHAGVAWTAPSGGQLSLGLIEREMRFNDIAGDHDVHSTRRFAAFSFTLKR